MYRVKIPMIRSSGVFIPPAHYDDVGTYCHFEWDTRGRATHVLVLDDDLEDGCEIESQPDARIAAAFAIQNCSARLEAAFRAAKDEDSRYLDGRLLVRLKHLDPTQVV